MANKSTKFKYYQPNKKDLKDEYGDCVIRALTKVMGKEWLQVFDELIPYVREVQANPNAPQVYAKYLEDNGFKWVGISVGKGKKRPTVQSFTKDHPEGTYILRVAHYIVSVSEGFFWDTWDSGHKSVYGYYIKAEG